MAKPLKGSAVFWMLTADDGRTNKKTVHAGTEIIINCKLCENYIKNHDANHIL